jgi:two-component system chemotaxis sensor kinase CheA
LDIVRKNLEQLNGLIEVETEAGNGTSFSITLPITLATRHVLLIQVAGQTLAVPTTTVERILYMDPNDLGSIEGKPAISVDGRALLLVSMGRLLELTLTETAPDQDHKIGIIILGVAEKKIAFQVDGFLNTQEIVVKPLGRQLSMIRNVSGGSILGNGEVVILLNVADLINTAQASQGIAPVKKIALKEAVRKKVLVVDDSITTRTLEKNILENAGYKVSVAADGMTGWEKIQEESFDAVVLDVDMPRLNGFAVTEKVKGDPRFEETPVILVTSLDSPRDKIRGMEAGADAYITKGTFDQQELLETIERLIGDAA